MLLCEESASIDCARVMRGIISIARAVKPACASSATYAGSPSGFKKPTSVAFLRIAASTLVRGLADGYDDIGVGNERGRIVGDRRSGLRVEFIGKGGGGPGAALHAHRPRPPVSVSLPSPEPAPRGARSKRPHGVRRRSWALAFTCRIAQPCARAQAIDTVLRSVPIFSISTSITSPSLRNSGGVRAKPTPSRRSGRNHVARQERHAFGEFGDQARNVEDHLAPCCCAASRRRSSET